MASAILLFNISGKVRKLMRVMNSKQTTIPAMTTTEHRVRPPIHSKT